MRIGINALFFIPGEVGGSETYLCRTLEALARVFPEHHYVVFTNRENEDFLRRRFTLYACVSFHGLNFRATSRLNRIIREQTQLPSAAARLGLNLLWSPGYTAPIRCSLPQVVSILDMQYKRYPEDLTAVARSILSWLVQRAAQGADQLIAISEFSKSEILRFTKAVPDRITVTPLAADPSFAEPVDAAEISAVRKRLLGTNAPYILCVAASYPHKNIHALVRAFGGLGTNLGHHLLLVGNPRRGEVAVERAIAALPDRTRIHRVARVSYPELRALYQGAEVFAFPSLYEGFGLPVLEAMMAGTPVIAANTASIPEVGGTAIRYFDPASLGDLITNLRAILELDESARRHVIEAGRARAKRFTWDETARLTMSAFLRAVDS